MDPRLRETDVPLGNGRFQRLFKDDSIQRGITDALSRLPEGSHGVFLKGRVDSEGTISAVAVGRVNDHWTVGVIADFEVDRSWSVGFETAVLF